MNCCFLSTSSHLLLIIASYPDCCILAGLLNPIPMLHLIYIVTYWDSCILLKSCFVIVKTTSHPGSGFFREVLLFLQSNAPVRSRYHKTLSPLQIKKKIYFTRVKRILQKMSWNGTPDIPKNLQGYPNNLKMSF